MESHGRSALLDFVGGALVAAIATSVCGLARNNAQLGRLVVLDKAAVDDLN